MLQITVPKTELWDEINQEFLYLPEQKLCLEHSLVSISKWESKWHKAFLTNRKKTADELIDYIRCMTITKNVKPITYQCLSQENINVITDYIDDPMSATFISQSPGVSAGGDTTTSELIYYWMVTLGIPFKCETWHINRLLTLIRICSLKNQSSTMNRSQIMTRNSALNSARRAKLNTKG